MQSTLSPALFQQLKQDINPQVCAALAEDIGSGDITAQLIPLETKGTARVITREAAIVCGQAWVNEVFHQVDTTIQPAWQVQDGDSVNPGQTLFEVSGSLRHLLTAERCALNFLQCLSGTATLCRVYANLVKHTNVKLLDTRKTIPGLRSAQKYAVTVGGCFNHRLGLYDAFLIKENHIVACGNISSSIKRARQQSPGKPVEVEVENFSELQQALDAQANIIMLDNFSVADMKKAVHLVRDYLIQHKTPGVCKLEASGGVNDENLVAIAETGVDYISIGGLTKNLRAIDLSMRIL
jgi:nicotinate-nucleotide pyrophosphorylase (carboxylating)